MKRITYFLIFSLFLLNPNFIFSQQHITEYELGKHVVDYMIKEYGEWNSIEAKRNIREIKDRILRVADKVSGLNINIVILNTDSVEAFALPGGFIVLSRGLYEICSNEDELSVIVSHEIAHELKGHLDAPAIEAVRLTAEELKITGSGIVNDFYQAIIKGYEVEADQYGILYVALSGYNVKAAPEIMDKLLSDKGYKFHPSKEQRKIIIADRMTRIFDNLEIFEAGVRFYMQGNYPYAEESFNIFLEIFPSREVYNNLASTYYQMAIERYFPQEKYQTKKSIDIDVYSKAKDVIKKIKESKVDQDENKNIFNEYLLKAIRNYKEVIDRDPDYFLAYNNIGCAYDYLLQYKDAKYYLENALTKKIDYKNSLNNMAVVCFHLNEIEEAKQYLLKLKEIDEKYPDLYFNYAAICESENNLQESQQYLKKYLDLSQNLTDYFGVVALEKILDKETFEQKIKEKSEKTIPIENKIGKIELDLKFSEILNIIGKPQREILILPSKSIVEWIYPEKGLKLLFDGKGFLINIIVDENFIDKTEKGVRIGDSFNELIEKYGYPNNIKDMDRFRVCLYEGKDTGLFFFLKEEKIISWELFFIED